MSTQPHCTLSDLFWFFLFTQYIAIGTNHKTPQTDSEEKNCNASTPIFSIEMPDLAPSSPESYSPRAQYSTPEVPSTTAPIDIITQNFRPKLLQTQRGNLTRLHGQCDSNNNQPTNHVVFCLPICLTLLLSRFQILIGKRQNMSNWWRIMHYQWNT